jgi:hypothetical protein
VGTAHHVLVGHRHRRPGGDRRLSAGHHPAPRSGAPGPGRLVSARASTPSGRSRRAGSR